MPALVPLCLVAWFTLLLARADGRAASPASERRYPAVGTRQGVRAAVLAVVRREVCILFSASQISSSKTTPLAGFFKCPTLAWVDFSSVKKAIGLCPSEHQPRRLCVPGSGFAPTLRPEEESRDLGLGRRFSREMDLREAIGWYACEPGPQGDG